MTTLTERSLEPESRPANNRGWEPGSAGLLLIPVLLCVGMLIFALAGEAPPARVEVPTARSCASSPEACLGGS
ncbi:MAG: hypothetical protein AVDCRST_MAG75-520 [uncultured Propionibacteriaceae bacterium]|uniref:Uncharacterized protein n=1 Tax=uncultured Propionibacteriaceae bacterium TaxID=257457 RepID=A0A6J4N2V8_9ACTN|nr:MAG: hypothetical protein AVDCRST_MAG75-520 [uncultured Propionibacteriaceae bacterium]